MIEHARTRARQVGTVALILAIALAPVTGLVAADAMLSATGAGLLAGDSLTPSALDRPTDDIEYGVGPGWSIKVDTNATNTTGKLQEWAGSSDQRLLVEEPGDGGWAVVAAPPKHIGTPLLQRALSDGLATKSYVVAVEAEMGMSTPEVEQLAPEDEVAFAETPYRIRAFGDGSLESIPDGVATKNESRVTTMADSRAITGVDNVSATGSGVLVAVVDTGTNTANGAVFGNGTQGSDIRIDNASKSFVDGDSVDAAAGDFEAIADGNGHGTHVASTIAANTTNASYDGMAPDADLLVLKALADDGSGSSADIADAIRYAADQDADVLSLSLGSAVYSQQIAEAVDYARSEGTVVAIATGNSRQTVRWTASPSDTQASGVISVGAANAPENGTSEAVPAYFSQIGPDPALDLSNGVTQGARVDIVAPGMQVEAKTPTTSSTVRSTSLSGTSMATPHVSGAAALLIASENLDDPGEVEARLTNGTRVMPDAATSAAGDGYLAVDEALAGTESDQAAARTAEAEARDEAWTAISEGSGGALFRLLGGLPGVA